MQLARRRKLSTGSEHPRGSLLRSALLQQRPEIDAAALYAPLGAARWNGVWLILDPPLPLSEPGDVFRIEPLPHPLQAHPDRDVGDVAARYVGIERAPADPQETSSLVGGEKVGLDYGASESGCGRSNPLTIIAVTNGRG